MVLLVAAIACFAYAWGIGDPLLEWYYAAGARSMAQSWHAFAYGAFDPAGLITLDKLPGAIWPQALAVRAFGPRPWAVVLPQVLEGALTVIVLHRAVRRLLGPGAALAAASVLAISPATVALNRGNIPDTLLTLLLVLAADAASRAIVDGRTRPLLLVGVWVGLAFQAKMLQAWLVLPALAIPFAVAAPGTIRRRLGQLGAAGAVTLVVSLSWMSFVSLTPAAGRPYVDGSVRDSVFEQVFVYNGLRRMGGWSPLSDLARLGLGAGRFDAPPAAWNRLLAGSFGRTAGWLLPAAAIVLIACLAARRQAPRTDRIRAGLLLWGAWLVTFVVAFSATSTGWPYYTAVLSPAVAALLGAGVALLRAPHHPGRGGVAAAALVVVVTVGHHLWLLPGDGVGVTAWLRPLLVGAAACALAPLAAAALSASPRPALARAGLCSAGAAVLAVPIVASASIVANRMGPFDTPFQSRSTTESVRAGLTRVPDLERFDRIAGRSPFLLAAQPAGLASRHVFHGGRPVVPIGGLSGSLPEPSVAKLAAMVENGEFHLVITVPSEDERYAWIASRCALIRRLTRAETYWCRPARASDRSSPPGAP